MHSDDVPRYAKVSKEQLATILGHEGYVVDEMFRGDESYRFKLDPLDDE